jgi:drug/metabolite transporter (DMT)-like permease
MPDAALSIPQPRAGWQLRHVAALIGANIALALGPWSVRLADCGPISTGFWRMILPVPLLFGLAIANRQRVLGFAPRTYVAIAIAGLAFAADLASWHIGIGLTRLGNVTLLGNAGSFVIMIWGIVALRRLPGRGEVLSIAAVTVGSAIMLGRSIEIGASTIEGDLYCILAGLLYSIYIITLQKARATLGSWALLAWASLLGAPLLLIAGPLHGEPFWPTRWWPLFTLALGSQVIGQGLLVYALRHFSPLVIGISLLTQPVVAVVVGWFVFGETLSPLDFFGMALVGAALVMARAGEKPAAG